nr:MAG TPA: hypothetical protein [Caudoviricetes sp.]
MEFSITSSQILAFCGLVTALYGVWKIVKEIKKPGDDLKETVERHSQILDKDNRRLKEVEESNQMILKCLYAILNHEITGNNVDKLTARRDELQEYLIDR